MSFISFGLQYSCMNHLKIRLKARQSKLVIVPNLLFGFMLKENVEQLQKSFVYIPLVTLLYLY